MLRIIQNSSSAGARGYYTTSDYYTEGQELQGEWHGLGAVRLGLSGKVEQKQWDALCENLDPRTGQPLTVRKRSDRRVGYDFNFHAPKSLSLLYGLTGEQRLLDAVNASALETIQEMEREMQTRVRREGSNEDRTTGNMVWGQFAHLTSRPVDGVPDPHCHVHCFAFNASYDKIEQRWKAGQFAGLKRDAAYFEAVYQSKLASRLMDLGIAVERNKNGWEIAGFEKATLKKFSRRTAEIEELAKAKGITNEAEKAGLGAKTRRRKVKNLSMEDLRKEWWSRLSDSEQRDARSLAATIGGERIVEREYAAGESVQYAIGHCFERESVVPERVMLREALRRGAGSASREAVEAAAAAQNLINNEKEGRTMITTREVLAEETAMLDFARRGRGTRCYLGELDRPLTRQWLNEGQKKAVKHVLTSSDLVMIIRGAAGTGKTTMMAEAVEGIEAGGHRVFTFAPSAGASRGVLREAGFKEADTVALLLADEKLQEKIRGQVMWIDEAGLLGTRTMGKVFAMAEKLDARVILSGDTRQHASVERGDALRLLESEAGLVSAEITAIQRQKGRYARAIAALSEGRLDEGFGQIDALGWIKEVADEERYKALANAYLASALEGETALVVSPTHAEGAKTTAEIRSSLREAGLLGPEQRSFTVLENTNLTVPQRSDEVNYEPGDVLVFHQNAKGYCKGSQVVVGDGPLPLEHAQHFTAFRPASMTLSPGDRIRVTRNGKAKDRSKRLSNGDLFTVKGFDAAGNIEMTGGGTIAKEFGHLTHGYVVTSHAAQGKSVNRILVAQSSESFGASSQKQFYVTASRGKESLSIYCDDREALLAAVSRGGDRLTATEFVAGRDTERQPIMIAQQAERAHEHDRQAVQAREGMILERQ